MIQFKHSIMNKFFKILLPALAILIILWGTVSVITRNIASWADFQIQSEKSLNNIKKTAETSNNESSLKENLKAYLSRGAAVGIVVYNSEDQITTLLYKAEDGTILSAADEKSIENAFNGDFRSYEVSREEQGKLKGYFDASPVSSRLGEILLETVIQGICLLLLIGALVFLFIQKWILGKVQKLSQSISSEGQPIPPELIENDEIGQLGEGINSVLSAFNGKIINIKESVMKAHKNGSSLADSTKISSAAIEEIQTYISEFKSQIGKLNGEIDHIRSFSTDLTDYSKEVEQNSVSQAADITETSASVEEMSAAITSINKTVETRLKIVTRNYSIASEGSSEMNKTQKNINDITESTQLIFDMVKVINNIASQTNLLAMNAAIEAAHAGDAGRGFAVVATEIRNLAENTTKQAKSISDSLKGIVERIQTTDKSANKAAEFFQTMLGGIGDVKEGMRGILEAIQELTQNASHVMKTLSSLTVRSEEYKTASTNMTGKVDNITTSLSSISRISEAAAEKIMEVAACNNEVFKNVEKVAQMGQENKNILDKTTGLLEE